MLPLIYILYYILYIRTHTYLRYAWDRINRQSMYYYRDKEPPLFLISFYFSCFCGKGKRASLGTCHGRNIADGKTALARYRNARSFTSIVTDMFLPSGRGPLRNYPAARRKRNGPWPFADSALSLPAVLRILPARIVSDILYVSILIIRSLRALTAKVAKTSISCVEILGNAESDTRRTELAGAFECGIDKDRLLNFVALRIPLLSQQGLDKIYKPKAPFLIKPSRNR